MMLKQGLHPTPDVEIKFWKNKAANLNSIFDQLQGDRVRRVLKFLGQWHALNGCYGRHRRPVARSN